MTRWSDREFAKPFELPTMFTGFIQSSPLSAGFGISRSFGPAEHGYYIVVKTTSVCRATLLRYEI